MRVAIAEACGWKFDGRDGWTDPSGNYHQALYGDTDKYGEYIPPNYVFSLDAMHEAEKLIVEKDKSIFTHEIMNLVGFDGSADLVDDYGEWSTSLTTSAFSIAHATAAQRAEAFLKTIGKWIY